jgi:hypothetical protein
MACRLLEFSSAAVLEVPQMSARSDGNVDDSLATNKRSFVLGQAAIHTEPHLFGIPAGIRHVVQPGCQV